MQTSLGFPAGYTVSFLGQYHEGYQRQVKAGPGVSTPMSMQTDRCKDAFLMGGEKEGERKGGTYCFSEVICPVMGNIDGSSDDMKLHGRRYYMQGKIFNTLNSSKWGNILHSILQYTYLEGRWPWAEFLFLIANDCIISSMHASSSMENTVFVATRASYIILKSSL